MFIGLNVTRERMIQLLNEDLAGEYRAIIAYIVYSQVLKGRVEAWVAVVCPCRLSTRSWNSVAPLARKEGDPQISDLHGSDKSGFRQAASLFSNPPTRGLKPFSCPEILGLIFR